MVHVVPQWKVAFEFSDHRVMTVWLHDNHVGNVMRSAASMQFSENGLEQPIAVNISRVEKANPSTVITTATT